MAHNRVFQPRHIPFFRCNLFACVSRQYIIQQIQGHADNDGFMQFFTGQYHFALLVDDFTLLVHHIVVFEQLRDTLESEIKQSLAGRKDAAGEEQWNEIEKYITLSIVDSNWKDHLLSMDTLKEGIGLRGYAQKNPLNEYKREGSQMFVEMIDRIREDVVGSLFRVRIESDDEARRDQRHFSRKTDRRGIVEHHGEQDHKQETVRRKERKIGRNEPCPCLL